MNTDTYKTLLESERDALVVQLGRLGRKNPDVPGDWEALPSDFDVDAADDTELSDKIEEMEEQNAVQNLLENRLGDITRALEKIEGGTYGVCEISGQPIEEARLKANPAARTCIAHKDEL
jgi:DnaK suppressor protein